MTDQQETIIPILHKTSDDMPWPDRPGTFYVLARDGLYLCRNHPFFQSCTKTETWPRELAQQESFLVPRYPKIPRRAFEQVVGFFACIADLHQIEAGALLVWNRKTREVEVLVPEQTATIAHLEYSIPRDLGPDRMLFGDIHSHVDGWARASTVDVHDEHHSPGLHVIVGRVRREPPDVHVEAVVDGERWEMEAEDILDGEYRQRDISFPELDEWVSRVRVGTIWRWSTRRDTRGYSYDRRESRSSETDRAGGGYAPRWSSNWRTESRDLLAPPAEGTLHSEDGHRAPDEARDEADGEPENGTPPSEDDDRRGNGEDRRPGETGESEETEES